MKSGYLGPASQSDDSVLISLRALIGGQASNPVRLPLLTGSMAPTIRPGDILLVKPVDGQRIHAGDVAVFIEDGTFTAHRVIFVLRLGARAFMLEMGDANRRAKPLKQDAVVGIVDAVERDGKLFPCEHGTKDGSARRIARDMLARHITESLPSERLRRIFRT